MTEQEAQVEWQMHKGNVYIFTDGPKVGNSSRALNYRYSGGRMFIRLSTGEEFDLDTFLNIMSLDGAASANVSDHYSVGGETRVNATTNQHRQNNNQVIPEMMTPEEEARFTGNRVSQQPPKPKQTIRTDSPVHTILEAGNSTERTIPINFNLEIITPKVYELIESSFNKNKNIKYFDEIVDYYCSKVDLDTLKKSIKDSIKIFLIDEFNYIPEVGLSNIEEDIAEGELLDDVGV